MPGDNAEELLETVLPKQERITAFQLLLVALSIYVLLALLLERVIHLSPATIRILQWSDTVICVVFLADFFFRLLNAPRKLDYLKWGWIDFVSSIPMLDVFRWGRLVRVARVLRVLRGVRSARVILRFLFVSRLKGALVSAAFAAVVVLLFASVSILHCETDPASTIRTPTDAVWWSISTMTSVGLTDKFPATDEGRMVGLLLALTGMGLFAVFTACFASWFLERGEEQERASIATLQQEVRDLRRELQAVNAQLQNKHRAT